MKSLKRKTVKICPYCKSTNITPYVGFKCGILYQCNDCKYVGPLILEEDRKKTVEKCETK